MGELHSKILAKIVKVRKFIIKYAYKVLMQGKRTLVGNSYSPKKINVNIWDTKAAIKIKKEPIHSNTGKLQDIVK